MVISTSIVQQFRIPTTNNVGTYLGVSQPSLKNKYRLAGDKGKNEIELTESKLCPELREPSWSKQPIRLY